MDAATQLKEGGGCEFEGLEDTRVNPLCMRESLVAAVAPVEEDDK